MDPQTTWQTLLEAFAQQDWPAVHDAAESLLSWLSRQGGPPITIAAPALPAAWHRAIARAACRFALSESARQTPTKRPHAGRPGGKASEGDGGLEALRESIERLSGGIDALTTAIDDLTTEVQWLNNQQPFEIALPSPPLASMAASAER